MAGETQEHCGYNAGLLNEVVLGCASQLTNTLSCTRGANSAVVLDVVGGQPTCTEAAAGAIVTFNGILDNFAQRGWREQLEFSCSAGVLAYASEADGACQMASRVLNRVLTASLAVAHTDWSRSVLISPKQLTTKPLTFP